MQNPKQHSQLWKSVGKAIAKSPGDVAQLLTKHNIFLKKKDDAKELLEGILSGLERNSKSFNIALANLLEREDQFIGAIAGAIGQVAGAIGSGQQKKAMKEQARAQTFSSLLAYKAQQDANHIEGLKLLQKQNTKPPKRELDKTLVIIIGVAIALVVVGLVYYQRSQPKVIQTITQPLKK